AGWGGRQTARGTRSATAVAVDSPLDPRPEGPLGPAGRPLRSPSPTPLERRELFLVVVGTDRSEVVAAPVEITQRGTGATPDRVVAKAFSHCIECVIESGRRRPREEIHLRHVFQARDAHAEQAHAGPRPRRIEESPRGVAHVS